MTSLFPFLHLCRWIEVFIPKFSISASYDLETILPKMGIWDAFNNNADFSGITKTDFLQLSKVSWSTRTFAWAGRAGRVYSTWLIELSHLTDKETQTLRGTVSSLGQKLGRISWLPGLSVALWPSYL